MMIRNSKQVYTLQPTVYCINKQHFFEVQIWENQVF